jgi:hypothetical protein
MMFFELSIFHQFCDLKSQEGEKRISDCNVESPCCVSTICTKHVVDALGHGAVEAVNELLWNFVPLVLDPIPQLSDVLDDCTRSTHTLFQLGPQVFDWIEIRRLRRPGQNSDGGCRGAIGPSPLQCVWGSLSCWKTASQRSIP